ncbi:hypothetical protein FK220_002830 [Flavobacteriaceae bacterium TP-CH-4]|uniref:Uncharacterized protein n=1 Tax=Pelagihabitans pacificus TaxID=2696054 RepID=A0A967E998_9FLAO|nr:hypothetical protein [Pelagihabitans pacificus]NHF58261.1 hypothetical protein [Pelagihabitans pacificus]
MNFCTLTNVARSVHNYFLRKVSMLLIAFMLGMSNVILEETRMVHDTREQIEQQEIVPDNDLDDAVYYEDVF